MKNIKSFKIFESKKKAEAKVAALKEYFFNIEDDFNDVVDVYYNVNTADFLSISINFKTEVSDSTIEEKAKRYKDISQILYLINRNIKKIEDDVTISELKVYHEKSIQFKIYYNSNDDMSIDSIFITDEEEDDFMMYVDKNKLEKLLNDKYGFDVSYIDITHELTDDETPYSKVSIVLNNADFGFASWHYSKGGKINFNRQDPETKELIKSFIEEFKVVKPLSEINFRTRLINLIIEMPVEE